VIGPLNYIDFARHLSQTVFDLRRSTIRAASECRQKRISYSAQDEREMIVWRGRIYLQTIARKRACLGECQLQATTPVFDQSKQPARTGTHRQSRCRPPRGAGLLRTKHTMIGRGFAPYSPYPYSLQTLPLSYQAPLIFASLFSYPSPRAVAVYRSPLCVASFPHYFFSHSLKTDLLFSIRVPSLWSSSLLSSSFDS